MAGEQHPSFPVLDVLTRAGADREQFCAAIDDDGPQVDARLVSDLLRARGRVGETLETRRALVDLCAVVRSLDAAQSGRITLDELRRGLDLHAGRTARFSDFHDARVLLRTLGEVLGDGRATEHPGAVGAQVSMLHGELRAWLLDELTGGVAASEATTPDAEHDEVEQVPGDERVRADALVEELLHGARHHPVTGLLGAAWVRGWSAVPIAGEMLGDDPAELDRLALAIERHEPAIARLVQVQRSRPPRWSIRSDVVQVGDPQRSSWSFPATRQGLTQAARERAGWAVLTTWDLDFAYVEGGGHHALLGPTGFVTVACGMPPLEAVATFREHVEELAVDGDPPHDLLEVAEQFGRLRRRSR